MRPRPNQHDEPALKIPEKTELSRMKLGLVLSGGGARAAYQAGAVQALVPYLEKHPDSVSIVLGSSIGAVNGLILGSCLKHGIQHSAQQLQALWLKRTFRNTFAGSPSMAFLRAIRMAFVQYMAPGPSATENAVFDPTPLMEDVNNVIQVNGGLEPENRHSALEAVGVMTTVEGAERKPLLFLSSRSAIPEELLVGASFEICEVESLTARHGFASAALPSVLPPVELNTQNGKLRLVDGGISQNVPVDPAVRLGAERVILIDVSGRAFWLDQYNESHDTRPSWEVPAGYETFCMRPPETFVIRNAKGFGPILRDAVSSSTKKFIEALGPTWPVFKLLKNKLGEELAYEVMSYVALDPDYLRGLIERGYSEAKSIMKNRSTINFQHHQTFEELVAASSD